MEVLSERTFSSEQKRRALDSVLQSQTFSRADQLRKFLRYICEMEASGRLDQITEYSIGTEALGRPRSYSPAADSGVRGRAHDLRQKLEQFYGAENPEATVRIGLRKGSYSPFYYEVQPREIVDSTIVAPAQKSPVFPVRKSVFERFWVHFLLLAIIAALSIRTFAVRPALVAPIFEEFWGPMLRPGSTVLLCIATPPSLLIKPYSAPPRSGTFRPILPDSPWYSRLNLKAGSGQPYMYFSGESPLFGDAEAAVRAAQLIATAGASLDLLPENVLRPAALRNRNVLLLGSSNYSVYAARILRNTPLFIHEDSALGEEIIQERSAGGKPGQMFIPRRDDTGQLVVVYGLLTVFSNETQSGQDSRTVVVSGVTGAGAAAALHFFASKTGLNALRDGMRQSGSATIPASYQVVVKSSKDQAVPLTWELAAYKVMLHPPTLE
jgi:hypothetical protein